MSKKYFYTRKLPHWQPEEQTFFITYRLYGSLPLAVIDQLKDYYSKEKKLPKNQSPERKQIIREEYFLAFESELEKNLNEPYWLREEAIAKIVQDSILFNDKKQYTLWSSCIMSNHVHVLLSTHPGSPLLNIILQNHKKFTAVHCNKVLGRSGPFWAEESYDTIIRTNAHYFRVVNYIIQNPVKAGLVKNWMDWKFTYLHPELEKEYKMKAKQA